MNNRDAAYRDFVTSPIELIELVVPGTRTRGRGRIVNVSSIAAREPIASLMLSNAHRAAALGAFKTLARQIAGEGITLNTLLTGRIATDRLFDVAGGPQVSQAASVEEVPVRRLGTVEEYAAAAAFLCSEAASYTTGVALPVDGGLLRSV